jgi:hypothetical protein
MAACGSHGRTFSTLNQIHSGRFTATIDLDLEFELIAFGEAMQARSLDGTDMHECIRLAVIAYDEAKALGAVEELHRAGGFLASRLTGGSRRPLATFGDDDLAHDAQFGRGNLAVALDQLEFQLLAFGQRFEAGRLHGTDVDERIVATFFKLDEAEALVRIEELYGATSLADNLTRPATRTAAAKATAAARSTKAAALAATEAIAATTEAITTAKAISATAEAIVAATPAIVTAEPIATIAAISSVICHI